MNQKDIYKNNFIKPIIFWGRLTNVAAFFLAFLPALYLIIVYKAIPPLQAVISATISTISIFAVFWFVEPISFFPILGIPGTYMVFLSGNISNMRVPCSVIAQSSAGVEEGTLKGSIVSVFGVGISIIVNAIVMILGALVGAKLIASFPPIAITAFDYILPAIFGAIFGQFAPNNFKAAIFALALGCIVSSITIVPQYIALPLCVFITIYFGIKTESKKMTKQN